MKRASLAAAFAACLLTSLSSHAQAERTRALELTGGDFLARCSNPPPVQGAAIVAMCQMYVAGIADALQVDGRMCFGPRMTARKLFAASLWWLQSRPREGYPASLMIRNGLIEAFPCRATTARQANRPSAREMMDRFTKAMEFGSAATKLLLMLQTL